MCLPGQAMLPPTPSVNDFQPAEAPRRAAAYVRMSTDHQQYSIANQTQTISDYAQLHGIRIVRTYADAARSGVTMHGRNGLRRLIADVQQGDADFALVLVYDVSR